METDVFAAIVLVIVALVAARLSVSGRFDLNRRRDRAERQFRSMRVKSDDPRFAFDGASATVVLDQDQVIGNADRSGLFMLHRVARNPHGEYFLFISGKRPYISHLSKERAKSVLRANRDVYAREFGDANAA